MDTLEDEGQGIVVERRCDAGSVATETEGEGADVGSDAGLCGAGICSDEGLELAEAVDDGRGRLAVPASEDDGGEETLVGPVAEAPGDKGGGAEGVPALGLVWDVGDVVDDEVLELLGEALEACGGLDGVHGWGEMGPGVAGYMAEDMRLSIVVVPRCYLEMKGEDLEEGHVNQNQ